MNLPYANALNIDKCQVQSLSNGKEFKTSDISIGESNIVVSAYTMYRHLQQYCSYLSI